MIIIATESIPNTALQKLQAMGRVLLFGRQKGPYPVISTHPDVFLCQKGPELFGSPSLSAMFRNEWDEVRFVPGVYIPGSAYPQTAIYNAVFAANTFVHHLGVSDPILKKAAQNMEHIHVNQAYTRCNLLGLSGECFITSDRGIEKKLLQAGKEVFYVDPTQVLLPGQKHGFFGGACGLHDQTMYVCGNWQSLKEAAALKAFCSQCGYAIVGLCDGPVIDIGAVFFIKETDKKNLITGQ